MFFLISNKAKLRKDVWTGRYTCPNCKQSADFHLYELRQYTGMFYIPIASVTRKRMSVCSRCDAAYDVPKAEYRATKKEQLRKLSAGQFPDEVILADCDPKQTKIGWSIFGLILASFFLILGLVSLVSILADQEFGVASMALFMIGLGALHAWFFLHDLIPALQKKKQYRQVMARRQF